MLDKIYEDFTTKLLPKISEGFSMTKDYFTELFGRYIKYLIITDLIWIIFGLIIIGISIHYWKKSWTYTCAPYDQAPSIVLNIIGLTIGIIITMTCLFSLVKDIYIPEIVIYENLSQRLTRPNNN